MNHTGQKILIVDDEEQVAQVTKTVLLSCYSPSDIIVVTRAEDAITILEEQDIAVLLCDLQMPGMNGDAVLREAHKINPRTISILVTGHATKEIMISALNDGSIWKCMEKPWDATFMCNSVQEAFKVYEDALAIEERDIEEESAKQTPKLGGGAGKPLVVKKGNVRRGQRRAGRIGKGRALRLSKLSIGKDKEAVTKSSTKKKVFKKKVIKKTQPSGKPLTKRKNVDERYQNLVLIQEGGSGVVYKADDTLLGMPVAIKVLADSIAQNKEALAELFTEARIAMQLSHKHIVRLHNVHETNGLYYLIMEYIDGCTLSSLLESRGRFQPDMVLQIVDIFDDALGYAHRRGVFHRDLKPGNIMLADDGLLKIIDFGLACLAETVKEKMEIRGTPYYMSPEEMACGDIDQRADIYSLSVTMHEFLVGHLPRHDGAEAPENILDYRPMPYPELPEVVQEVLQKGWARNVDDRWSDMASFSSALRPALRAGYHLD